MDSLSFLTELQQVLTDHVPISWGSGEKSAEAGRTYGVIYFIVGAPAGGSWSPDSLIWETYQLTLVGISQEQVRWLSQKCVDLLIGTSGGSYTHAFTKCLGRFLVQTGPVVRGNDDIYYATDQYRFLLEA
jgi:hypothetical protein